MYLEVIKERKKVIDSQKEHSYKSKKRKKILSVKLEAFSWRLVSVIPYIYSAEWS